MLSTKDKQGIGLIAGVFAVLATGLIIKASLDTKPKPRADNCVGDVTANTVVVLDYTDQITDQTREEIMARTMAHIHDKVKVNERVSVFTISELSKRSLKPLVSLCRPPEDGNRAIENIQLIKKRFQQNFEMPLRKALSEAPEQSNESPITQAISDITSSQYLRGASNTLLIFSDMLEHTSAFSLMRCTSPTHTIAQYRASRVGALERPEFKNTSVVLNLIPRLGLANKSALKCRDQLWPWFFGNNSGDHAGLTVDYLPGGPPIKAKSPGVQK